MDKKQQWKEQYGKQTNRKTKLTTNRESIKNGNELLKRKKYFSVVIYFCVNEQ